MMTPPPEVRLCLVVMEDGPDYQSAAQADPEEPLGQSTTAARWLGEKLAREPYECLGAVFLDSRLRALSWSILYRGTLDRAAVEPRGLLCAALLTNAAALLLFHNHPSGDPDPSADDLTFTRRMDEAAKAVGLRLVDHLVIGSRGRHCSLRERGGW